MSSRSERIRTRSSRREQEVSNVNETPSEHQRDQYCIGRQSPMVSRFVPSPPVIDLDAIEDDDDDVVESTAADFHRAKRNNSRSAKQEPLVVDTESVCTTKVSENRTRLPSDIDCVERNNSRKSEAVAHVDEPKFNCPICICPFTEETSTKCGHIFCNSCIKNAISQQAKCPTCRKKVSAKDLFRVFFPRIR